MKMHALALRMLTQTREPDVFIGGRTDPYMLRWWVIPRNRFFNVYLHHFLRSDDDRALHDHPWWNFSWLLRGSYYEVVPLTQTWHPRYAIDCRNQLTYNVRRNAGAMAFRRPTQAHRIALMKDDNGREMSVWTLFITGPVIRQWGFWCRWGWRAAPDFIARDGKDNTVGQGCD